MGALLLSWHRNRTGWDAQTALIYVHIGKCGGASLWDVIQRSPVIETAFKRIEKIHVRKPPILKRARYLIVVRNPISRAISAFNWRYDLVVESAVQNDRFSGEHTVLSKYGTLDALAKALYRKDGTPNPDAARDFLNIHHLRENIAFYLTDLIAEISEDQIFAVMTTETLDQDIGQVLDIATVPRTHDFRSKTPEERLYLSSIARTNLRRFLAEDYACLEELSRITGMSENRRATILA